MVCYCFLRNIHDELKGGKTAYELRFGIPCEAPRIPFGAEVTYLPITHKDKKTTHQFGCKHLRGLFLGYVTTAGGGWQGDLWLIDQDDLNNAKTYGEAKQQVKRSKADEVFQHAKIGSSDFRCLPERLSNLDCVQKIAADSKFKKRGKSKLGRRNALKLKRRKQGGSRKLILTLICQRLRTSFGRAMGMF